MNINARYGCYGASNGTWSFCNQNQFCVHKLNSVITKFYLSYKTLWHILILSSLQFCNDEIHFFRHETYFNFVRQNSILCQKSEFCVTKVNSNLCQKFNYVRSNSLLCHKSQFCIKKVNSLSQKSVRICVKNSTMWDKIQFCVTKVNFVCKLVYRILRICKCAA